MVLTELPYSNLPNSHDSASFSSNVGQITGYGGPLTNDLALKGTGAFHVCPSTGGKKRKTKRKTKKIVPWAGWSKLAPKGRQLTKMYKKCGKRCFLGRKTKGKRHPDFPICKKKTCKISKKGLAAAYVRARQWGKKRSSYKKKGKPTHRRSYYTRISRKAKNMLKKRGVKIGKTNKRKHYQRGGTGHTLSYNYSTGAPLPSNMTALANPAPYHMFKNDC